MTEETSTTICRPDMSYEDEDDGGLDEESSCCCCHCGAGQEDSKTKSYIKMREHLQQRLKAKSSGLASGSSACDSSTGSRSSSSKSNIDGYANVDDLLNYIEGGKSKGKTVAQPNPKKAAKKARQKAKKLENAKAEELAAAKRVAEVPTPSQDRVPNGMVRITHNPLTNSAVITPLYGPLESSPSYLQQPLGFTNPSQPATRLLNPASSNNLVIPPNIQPSSPTKLSQAPVQQPSINTTMTPASSQPQQMVTIRRVMQPNLSEPVVTVTLKGDTPDYDRVLFTLINGQVLPTNGDKSTANPSVPSVPKPSNQQQNSTIAPPVPLSRKKLKKQEKRRQKLLLRTASAPLVSVPQPQPSFPATATFSDNSNQDFTLDNFRLPPGITLTRVHQGSYPHSAHPELPVRMVDRNIGNNKKNSVNSGTNTSQSGPNPIIVTNPPKAKESMGNLGGLAAPNVIVVDTRKIQVPQKPVQMCSVAVQTGWDEDDDVTLVDESQLSKKQRKKLRRERQLQQEQQVQAVLEVQMASLRMNANDKTSKKNNTAVAPKYPTNNFKTTIPPTINEKASSNSSKTKKKKKKNNNATANATANAKQGQGSNAAGVGEDKWEENVFVPKSDLDLEGGDLDEDERELEAFKRFCFNTVPPERKEKVRIHLNVKDIFGKKTTSGLQHNSSCKST